MSNKEMIQIEREMIIAAIGKRGFTTADITGHRYMVVANHARCFAPENTEADEIPAFRVYVEQRYTYETIQNRTASGFRTVRKFVCDGFTLNALKAIPAYCNA